MNSSDTWKIVQNIVAQQGIECDLYAELAKATRIINMMDQGKMMPPPVPPEITEPTMSQQSVSSNTELTEPAEGKYDNI